MPGAKSGRDKTMSEKPSSPRDLAKYLAAARQHLTEDKVRDFEATYRRMQDRAARWDLPKPAPIEPKRPPAET